MNYLEINRNAWNSKVDAHLNSGFYNQEDFLKGKNSLNPIELNLLGDVNGKSILHLQCHFGQDSISLSRLGAAVTGIDLSDKAIETGKQLANELNLNTRFVCSDLYELPNKLDETFDIVFTSYGTIGWLPDLEKWAGVVSKFLKPGGKFIMAEFHPVVWMFDDAFEKVAYNYFNSGAIIETSSGTYADRSADIETKQVMWNHGLAETIDSLLKKGLKLSDFREYDYSPYACFLNTIEIEPGKFRIKHLENTIPMVFSIVAEKEELY
jgi:2-polyprenyl-3-methyl-5-hydroxy-6-metoxy-1,4-benzoquinol methylase